MKNKKGNTMMVAIMITVVIAVIVLGVIVTLLNNQQQRSTVTDDQFTADNGTCVRVTDNCIQSTTNVENASGSTTLTGNFTVCPGGGTGDNWGYSLRENGGEATLDNVLMNATYVEISCERLSGTTLTIVNYLPILLAVAIFIFVALTKMSF